MTLDRSLAITTAAFFALILSISGLVVVGGSQRQLDTGKMNEMQATALLLTSSMAQAASLSATHADRIANDPQVVALMKAGDRDGLARMLKPSYEALASEAGVNMLHFHTVDIKSFLRVQDPTNFGQDLSAIRPMILAANRSRVLQKGLEVGLAGLSLRAVAPIQDGETLVGTVEVGVDLKSLLELAKSASGADFALFLSQAMTGVVPKGADASKEPAGLAIEAATNTTLFQALQDRRAIGLSREPVQGTARIDDRRYGTFSQPLLDYSGRMIGAILIVRDFSGLDSGFLRAVATAMIVVVVGMIAAFSVVMIAVRAMVVRPLAALATYAEMRASGKPLDDAPAASGLADYTRLHDAIDALAAGHSPPRGGADGGSA
ncbi:MULTISPECIES: cache domain-containing protein [Alphaproteobacteria]|uniref:Double Cache domain-containing protein n=2 Tax=Alphaproteobacteria TaxID=28211 RepID=A0A512HF64_9HYPH|nr:MULTISPECIES: cache domain-containing protein [Alphaproteobacteria]GEO84096.1 hypothetical protein RNA01_10280 [Ciceribacter naphthalenivorans]GLR24632.1 hypothetical protein GCM10007920_44260 [Ciceribacter naphthalenivorans]GLT07488.1 hypothetical protein GCM10007926_44260 [Sphingomonas psychrolutea]